MSNSAVSRLVPGPRVLMLAGFCLAAVLLAAFVWQESVRSSKNDEADKHTEIASLIKSAEADGTASGALLQQYVGSGDASLLPQMQAKTDSGVKQLSAAITQAGGDPNQFVQQGATLVQGAGRVVALRQSGDVQGAVSALTALSTDFGKFVAAQDAFVAAEQAKAVEARTASDDAESAALWLAIGLMAVMVAVISGILLGITRRVARRSTARAAYR